MAAPLTVTRNDYHRNPKRNDIPTPPALAKYLADLVVPVLQKKLKGATPLVLDPACGEGQLLAPFTAKGCKTAGVDTIDKANMKNMNAFKQHNFLAMHDYDFSYRPDLVVLNPPFNYSASVADEVERAALQRKMLPELFALKVFEIWGSVPLMLFAPMGMILNQRMHSTRWKTLRDNKHAKITGRIALPLNIFRGVEFHTEILLFNLRQLKPHYWLPDYVIEERQKEYKAGKK